MKKQTIAIGLSILVGVIFVAPLWLFAQATPPSPDNSPGKPQLTISGPADAPVFADNTPMRILVPTADPVITIWYGDSQTFGQIGTPQRWIHILGRVSDSDSLNNMVLTYTLNSGDPRTLQIGPVPFSPRRLYQSGDFVAEICVVQFCDNDPDDTPDPDPDINLNSTNTIVFHATDNTNNVVTKTVTFTHSNAASWPRTFTADWSSAGGNIQNVAQVVDGHWEIDNNALRPVSGALGYDRLVAIGDMDTWTDYEVIVPVTIHGLEDDPDIYNLPSNGPGLGLIMRWQGHFLDESNLSDQPPRWGWQELGAFALYHWDTPTTGGLQMIGYSVDGPGAGNEIATNPNVQPQFGVQYIMKMAVESLPDNSDQYQFKMWTASDSEPVDWDMTGIVTQEEAPDAGSLLLVAHHVDASFGNVEIRPLSSIEPELTINQVGNGTVTVTPNKTTFDYGEEVTISAAPALGYTFASWSGDITNTSNAVTFNITQNMTITASFAEVTTPASDDFNSCDTLPTWTFVNPAGDGSYLMRGQQLALSVPAGATHDLFNSNQDAVRLMTPADDNNFVLEAKFETIPTQEYQIQGIVAEDESGRLARFDFSSNGSGVNVFAGTDINGTTTTQHNEAISIGGAATLYLRVTRSGNQWSLAYSTNGTDWTMADTFTFSMTVTEVGLFAGNAPKASNPSPAFTAVIDYFFNAQAPIVPEDPIGLGLETAVNGNGAIFVSPNKTDFSCGEQVTLTAQPGTGWQFVNWSGDASGSSSPITISYDLETEATADFIRIYQQFIPLIVKE